MLGLLLAAALLTLAVVTAASLRRGPDVGEAARVQVAAPPPLPTTTLTSTDGAPAHAGARTTPDCPSQPALLRVSGDAACALPVEAGEPRAARALAQRARADGLGCDELDWHEAHGGITPEEAATLRSSTGCPAPPAATATVRYQVASVGAPAADLDEFRRLAARALADPRGWRGAGVAFVEAPPGAGDADFTLWLAEAAAVPGFGAPCQPNWSCAAGDDVVVNDLRWREASPAWLDGGGSVDDYRRMVVGHEVGHWLGLGHDACPGPGAPAPLMQQQSKDLGGCRPNPWPLPAEVAAVGGPAAGAALGGG